MTSRSTDNDPVSLPELLDALTATIVAESDDEDLVAFAEKLRTVVEEATDVVETIDFERLPDAIDGEELPDAIEAEKLADALENGDATEMIDLAELYEAVDLLELWKTVDLPALREEGEELNVELTDLLGTEDESSEDEDGGMFDEAVDTLLGAESRQQALVSRLDAAIDAFRVALFETHATVRRLYEANQRDHDRGDHSRSRRPTTRSTMPRGPLVDSASTRVSTVPRRVRHSRTKGRSRVYGRRFERVGGR
ncbi:hypothetical protein HAPAU_29080 [Halalkalicoccus paucihalophilus]|uniref:Uncharacterized protein n=1 Tax=Halalkalicoccus paucihalophilus TaxID=1008153 RepID=A0A151ACK6_9EURY|nr:hypothetical protein [Halalkalicoccus paucihalophilus]KYH25087.1 hypothetical protein HAPAU_29080 [Halalkalicoccus paucihalophilus]